MHTIRNSSCLRRGGVPGPRGCTWPWGVYLVLGGVPGPRGVPGLGGVPCPWRVYLVPGGVPGPGVHLVLGVYLVGVYLVPGMYLVRGGCTWSGGYLPRYSLPCGQTHMCKNITFSTSLRTVISTALVSGGSRNSQRGGCQPLRS